MLHPAENSCYRENNKTNTSSEIYIMRTLKPCYILLLIIVSLFIQIELAVASSIEDLTIQIAITNNKSELSKLYTYRARTYTKAQEKELANKDYLKALGYNYAGWLMNEYGYFLYKKGDYKRAYVVAKKSVKDFPHTSGDALKLQQKAKKKYDVEYKKNNPETIVVSEQNIKRNQVTKYDLNKNKRPQKRGVITAKKAPSKSSPSGYS